MAGTIERVARPSAAEFTERFLVPQRPVILTGVTDGWPALARWEPDHLKKAAGAAQVWVQFVSSQRFEVYSGVMRKVGLPYLVDYLRGEGAAKAVPGKPRERAYLQVQPLRAFPGLAGDVTVPDYVPAGLLKETNFWLGGGGVTPLHFDAYDNLLTQVRGTKRLRLFPPGLAGFHPLPLSGHNFQQSQVDIDHVDAARFPGFPADQALEGELAPGEMIFIPMFWWHQVEHAGWAVSVNFWWRGRDFLARLVRSPQGRRVIARMLLMPVFSLRRPAARGPG